MSTINSLELPASLASESVESFDQQGWGFGALICVVTALFIRPTDVIPQLRDEQVYQWLILVALALSFKPIAAQLKFSQLASNSVTCCLIMLIGVIGCSHLVHGFWWGAQSSVWATVKLFALFLLMISVINTTSRLEFFARWLVLAISTMSCLALADKAGWIELNAFSPINDPYLAQGEDSGTLSRIRGSGIFEDPNDLGLVVVSGIILVSYFLLKPKQGWPRYFWLLPGGVLCATLAQTYSRGAFLALAAAVPAWFFFYRGWRYAIVGSFLLLPIIAIVFSGRMTEVNSLYEGTGQSRVQLWADTLMLFGRAPILGIGEGMLVEEVGMVSHNSFLQCYAELGLIGGTLFLTIFLVAIVGLIPSKVGVRQSNSNSSRLHGTIFAVVIAYGVGIMTLSRQFVPPTFLVLGLAVAAQLTSCVPLPSSWRIGNELAIRSTIVSLIFLGSMYVVTHLLIHGA